jgi:hypothetical protein
MQKAPDMRHYARICTWHFFLLKAPFTRHYAQGTMTRNSARSTSCTWHHGQDAMHQVFQAQGTHKAPCTMCHAQSTTTFTVKIPRIGLMHRNTSICTALCTGHNTRDKHKVKCTIYHAQGNVHTVPHAEGTMHKRSYPRDNICIKSSMHAALCALYLRYKTSNTRYLV